MNPMKIERWTVDTKISPTKTVVFEFHENYKVKRKFVTHLIEYTRTLTKLLRSPFARDAQRNFDHLSVTTGYFIAESRRDTLWKRSFRVYRSVIISDPAATVPRFENHTVAAALARLTRNRFTPRLYYAMQLYCFPRPLQKSEGNFTSAAYTCIIYLYIYT